MLGAGDAGAAPHSLIALVLALPALAGCLGPNVPQGPEGFHVILVETGYDASERGDSDAKHEAVDLPTGHPAAGLEVALGVDSGPGYDGRTWEYDEPCPNRESFHGTTADCSDFKRQEAYVLPSPKDADNYTKIHYVLDGNGTVVFHIPQAVELLVHVSDRYTEELRDKAEDPNRCDERPHAGSRRVETQGAAERNRDRPPRWIVITGDARISIPWYGTCPDDVSS